MNLPYYSQMLPLSSSTSLQLARQKYLNADSAMKVIPIPCLKDNYAYLLICPETHLAAAIDPVEPPKVLACMRKYDIKTLKFILTTHHHWDHAGGNVELKSQMPAVQVVGYDERINAMTLQVDDGQVLEMGSLKIKALYTPCHTNGSLCYHVTAKQDKSGALFSGDTMFVGGCGRFFEGSAGDMHTALNKRLSVLPDDTSVYCGHEYTKSNLEFAISVEPSNEVLYSALRTAKEAVTSASMTVPSTLAQEKALNPFMRLHSTEIKKNVVGYGHVKYTDQEKLNLDVMAGLRQKKDDFK